MTFPLTCGLCGHADEVPDDPATAIYTCDQCGGRTSFGAMMPRITTNPHEDRRFVVSTFVHGMGEKRIEIVFTLDRQYGAQFALDLLSVCDVEAFNASQAARAK